MSRGTTVTLMRVYGNKTAPEEDVAKMVAEQTQDSWSVKLDPDNSSSGSKTMKKRMPAFIRDTRLGKNEDYARIVVATREEADVLLSWSFTSSFTQLADVYGLSYYERENDTAFISQSEARDIAQACRYLLAKNYSDEFEQILDNEWVEKLANPDTGCGMLADWVYRKDKKALAEAGQDDCGVELSLKRLLVCLETFLSYDRYEYDAEDGNHAVLAVTAWG